MGRPSEVSDSEFRQRTLSETFILVVKGIRLEPAALLHMTSAVMVSLLVQNLMLERACRVDAGYLGEDCDAAFITGNFTKEEEFYEDMMNDALKIVANIKTWSSIIEYSLPVALLLVVGTWSDKHGRKPPLMLPIIGYMTTNLLLYLSLHFTDWSAKVIAACNSVPLSVTGSSAIFGMAAYSWTMDVSEPDLRTVKIGIFSFSTILGTAAGLAIGGNLFQFLGYTGIFILGEGMEILALLCIIFFVKETRPLKEQITPATESRDQDSSPDSSSLSSCSDELRSSLVRNEIREERRRSESGEKGSEETSQDAGQGAGKNKGLEKGLVEEKKGNAFTDLFDYQNVIESFKTALKPRSGNKRAKIWILFITLLLGLAPTSGEVNVLYLFVKKQLNWDIQDYAHFGTYMMAIAGLGTALSMGIFSSWLKLSDPMVGIISCLSQMSAAFIYGFAQNWWMMYLAPLVDCINGTVTVICRAMANKLVPQDEVGRLNSFFGIGDALIPLVANSVYSKLYAMTLTSFPGAFFLVSAAITVPVLLIFAWFYWQVRKEQSEELRNDGTGEEGGDSTDSEASGSQTPEKERF